MEIDKLIEILKDCYDEKLGAFYAEIPAKIAKDIFKYLEELKEIKEKGTSNVKM